MNCYKDGNNLGVIHCHIITIQSNFPSECKRSYS